MEVEFHVYTKHVAEQAVHSPLIGRMHREEECMWRIKDELIGIDQRYRKEMYITVYRHIWTQCSHIF